MRELAENTAYLCLLSALCTQLFAGSGYINLIRFVFGMETMHLLLDMAGKAIDLL